MNIVIIGLLCGVSYLFGVMMVIGYMIWRMMRNKGWDDSNMTNALRLLSHVVLHPEDFGKMYYLTDTQMNIIMETMVYTDNAPKRPFWYVSEDEFEGVVKTRPD